ADLASNEGRARAAERALAAVAEHPTDLVRDQYVMDVAAPCRCEPGRLRAQRDGMRSRTWPGGGLAGASPGGRAGRRAVANEPPDRWRDDADPGPGRDAASGPSSVASPP